MGCMEKLVRDRLGVELESAGVRVRRVEGAELERMLRLKIVEEALELLESGSVEEAADLVEAVAAWASAAGYGWSAIESVRKKKLAERGGFKEGFVAVICDEV